MLFLKLNQNSLEHDRLEYFLRAQRFDCYASVIVIMDNCKDLEGCSKKQKRQILVSKNTLGIRISTEGN